MQHVAWGPSLQPIRAERFAQVGDVTLERAPRRVGRFLAPDLVDQEICRDDLVRSQQQMSKHEPLLRPAQPNPLAACPDLNWPQQLEAHAGTVASVLRFVKTTELAHTTSMRPAACKTLVEVRAVLGGADGSGILRLQRRDVLAAAVEPGGELLELIEERRRDRDVLLHDGAVLLDEPCPRARRMPRGQPR